MTKHLRFQYKGTEQYGLVEGESVLLLRGSCPADFQPTGESASLADVQLLPPCNPQKIICTGLNYTDTVLRDGATLPQVPLLFLKAPSAMILAGENIRQTPMIQELACEAELGVVIGKDGTNIPRDKALEYVWGYLIANDVTATDLQKADGQWTRSKSFDTFLPLSSEIVSGIDPSALQVRTYINGEIAQDGNTRDMIFDIPYLISYISHAMSLRQGDIIITGTPGGYGKRIQNGDVVSIQIEHLGEIANPVVCDQGDWCLLL